MEAEVAVSVVASAAVSVVEEEASTSAAEAVVE